MAEQLLFGAADRIIETLGSLVAKEFRLLWGVGDEIESLRNTVSAIKAVLLDAEEKQAAGNHAVGDWLGKLNDAIYDADDLLDAISTEALRREVRTLGKKARQVRIFFSESNQLAFRLRMGLKIKAIGKRLDANDADRGRFHLEERHVERHNTHSLVRAEAVIGREDDKKAVIECLMDSNFEENVSVLSIVGMGGLGKTTLAQLVFNDEGIKKHFELKMWNEDHEKWSRLKEVLMGGARGSRILVTTCSESVARIAGTVQSYSLSGLDEDASWSLFKQMAFEKGKESENSSIIALGREILEKCLAVPLAIRTTGSLLGSKNPKTEWLSFKNNGLSKISQKENDILPTLKLSYDQLPSHLKHCFTYCSLFPKDYKSDKSTLIKHWIAQGFVKLSDENRCLEDVGNEYFMNLLWRSFFQEAEMDKLGNVIRCKMHDLMHNLALLMAGSLITTLDDKKRNTDERTRHMSFVGYYKSPLCKASRIRTFLFGVRAEIDCDTIFSSFKFLRVLDLHGRDLHFLPSSIGKFEHLRYLDLSWNFKLEKLPYSITRLQNLQTLILSNCVSLKELPRGIKRLVNLRHLDTDECYDLTHIPRGLGQLTNLQTLSSFVVHSSSHSRHSCGLQELNGLNKLRGELVIFGLRHGKCVKSEYKVSNLKEKQHLHALGLCWKDEGDVNDSDVANDEASMEGFQLHPNLKQLRL